MKNNLLSYSVTARTVTKNVCEFLDALALTAVSGYSIYEALQPNHKSFWYKGLLIAGVLIALQAFVLLVKHFNKPDPKYTKQV